MTRFLLLITLAVTASGCLKGFGDDIEIPDNFPAFDLSIRQSPNDTVRVGQTVLYTAVFPDSTKPGFEVTWFGLGIPVKKGRVVEVTAQREGLMGGEVIVDQLKTGASVSRGFITVVLP